MKQVSAIWRTVAIIAVCLCLLVGTLWIAGVQLKKAPASQTPSDADSASQAPETEPASQIPDAGTEPASQAPDTDADPLSLWTDSAEAKRTLISYLEAVTDESGPDFIPTDHRVAVFDLDGTLFCETDPNYFDYTLLVHRVLEDPDYREKATAFEKETAYKILDQNLNGTSFTGLEVDHGACVASAFSGMTLDEFNAYIQEFKQLPMPSYDGMLRGEGWYRPMLQVAEYLQANDFTVYIVSGTDRFIVRGIVDNSPLNIPMGHVIGSDETVIAPDQGDTDGLNYVYDDDDQLVLGGEFLIKNLKMNKVAVIAQEIGVQPVLSFGNSTGDASMAEYVTSGNPYKSLAFMLCCDDLERENGSAKKADKMYELCEEFDWVPVSMKNDWTTIYGEGVTKKAPAEEPAAGIDYLALVNKEYPLPEGWEEALELVLTTNSLGDEIEVERAAYLAYLELKEDLAKDGVYIDLDSARRSIAAQQDIVVRFTEKYGEDYVKRYVAVPGYSEHHTGLALDLYLNIDGVDVYYNEDMVQYPEIWAKIHAKLAEHGFILRYLEGKEAITGYSYEPWHIRYLHDPSVAKQIMEKGLTLEEYLGKLPTTDVAPPKDE